MLTSYRPEIIAIPNLCVLPHILLLKVVKCRKANYDSIESPVLLEISRSRTDAKAPFFLRVGLGGGGERLSQLRISRDCGVARFLSLPSSLDFVDLD